MLDVDGQALAVDRAAGTATAQVGAAPTGHAIVAVGPVPELREGNVVDLAWCVPGQSERQPTRFVVPNRAAGWMVHNGAGVWLAGRLPADRPVVLTGASSQRAASGSPGQGVIRVNGAVAWTSPLTKQESPQFRFEVPLAPWAGQPVLLEFAVEGEVKGFSAGDYHGPRRHGGG